MKNINILRHNKNPVRVTASAVREVGFFSCFFHFLIFRITKKFFSFDRGSTERRCNGLHSAPKKPLVFDLQNLESGGGNRYGKTALSIH